MDKESILGDKEIMPNDFFPIVADASQPLGKAVGGTLANAWQGIIGDKVAAWRIRNAIGVDQKLREVLAESGISLNLDNLPEGFAFRWFERATESEESELRELFAKLLANAAAGHEDALRKRNVELISNLTPEDAKFLSYVAERFLEFEKTKAARYSVFAFNYDFLFTKQYKEAGFDSELPIDSLISLGILRLDRDFRFDSSEIGRAISFAVSDQGRGVDFGISHIFEQNEKLVLTEVGSSLLRALFTK